VVVIEHHLDLLAEADYLVELGPDGGPGGGQLLYQGPLPGLQRVKRSPTAPYLRVLADKGPSKRREKAGGLLRGKRKRTAES
jgi:excinuclease UvrABC ATPase subunit